MAIEWRVVSRSPRAGTPDSIDAAADEQEATIIADAERQDYPHHLVWIECRYVTPWTALNA